MSELKARTARSIADEEEMLELGADSPIESAQVYLKSEADEAIAEMKEENATLRGANDEKTERIVELQKQVDELDGVKKSAELILMNLLDCGLIKEWYFNGKFNAILKADDPHLQIAELKQKLEDAKATAYTENVDAGMRERRLRRALWRAIALFCARSCEYFSGIMSHCLMGQDDLYRRCEEKKNKYLHAMYKCRAKAEEYK